MAGFSIQPGEFAKILLLVFFAYYLVRKREVLSHADRDLLAPRLEGIELDARQILEVPSDPIGHVYFVESGLVSVVGTTQPDHRIEVGMVGYEGMTGLCIVLGDDRSANETVVQSAGSALRSAGSMPSRVTSAPVALK